MNIVVFGVVDIEDMPRATAFQLVEALAIVKHVAGDHYPEVIAFHDSLRSALEKERPIWRL